MEDFKPPVNPEKEIDDPEDSKPEDWVDTKMIADPKANEGKHPLPCSACRRLIPSYFQPEDWDEDAPYEIPDEEAVTPEGWLENEPETIPDPGECLRLFKLELNTNSLLLLDAEKPEEGGMMRRTVTGSPRPFVTRTCDEAPGLR